MRSPAIAFLDRTFAIEAPSEVTEEIAIFFGLAARQGESATPTDRVVVTPEAPGRFVLAINGGPPTGALSRGEVIARLGADIGVERALGGPAILLKAAAVGWGNKAVVVIGQDGSGKSALAAWLVEKGFAYLADDSVALPGPPGVVAGFPGPLALKAQKLSHVAALTAFRAAPSVAAGERMLIAPHPAWLATDPATSCGLIIEVRFEAGATLRLDPLLPAAAELRLLEATRRVVIPGDAAHAPIVAFATASPALRLTYGHYDQLDGVLDFLARILIETETPPGELEKFLNALPRATPTVPPRVYPIPARTERTLHPRLTIGMATYDDFDGTYFTIQAIRMYHPEIVDQVEFVVVDNHPDGPCGEPLKKLEESIPNYRYIPCPDSVGTAAARNLVFAEASGAFVLCIDCHVFIVPGALRRLLDYFAQNPESGDLLQGPIIYDDLKTISTNYEPTWLAGFLGVWGNDLAGADPDAPPFEIAMQGLGLFACRKDAWLGFHREFRGFGGEEGYIHEKFRRAGHRTLCLPFLRWMHRFARPLGVPFPNTWIDRVRNYLIGFREFDLPTAEMQDHFRKVVGAEHADELFAIVNKQLDDVSSEGRR